MTATAPLSISEIQELVAEHGASVSQGRSIGELIADAEVFNDDVIYSVDKAIVKSDGLAILKGNLAPDGAVIKPPAAEAHLLKHTGKAVVFKNYDDLSARIDSADLDRIELARNELHALFSSKDLVGKPFLILLNKQDLPNAKRKQEMIEISSSMIPLEC